MRLLVGLIVVVYLTGMASELSVTQEGKWSEAFRSELRPNNGRGRLAAR